MGKYHKGKYKLKNPQKYLGNVDDVVYRSGWERSAFIWLDKSPDVKGWVSEEIVIPYRCATDNRMHKYYIDIYYETVENKRFLIEIKPEKQTLPPKAPSRRTKKFLNEQLTYAKNVSKWKAAEEFAKDNGLVFAIWTENIMKSIGIKII